MSRYAPLSSFARAPAAVLHFAPLLAMSLALDATLLLFLVYTTGAVAAIEPGPTCTVAPGGAEADFATIQAAIDDAGCVTVGIAPGVYAERLEIERDVTLRGAGQDVTILDAGQGGRAVNVVRGSVEISDVTIQNGLIAGPGAGILNYGTLVLVDSKVQNNQAVGDAAGIIGGGIQSRGVLTLTQATVAGNSAFEGGGIATYGPTWIDSTVITGNLATAQVDQYQGGAGVYVDPSGHAVISATQIVSNAANAAGGGIFSSGELNVLASTIAGNSARWSGGGIAGSGPITVTGCTIQGNTAGDGGGIALAGGLDGAGAWRTIDRTAIVSNTATGSGGGLVLFAGYSGIKVRVTRNRLHNNAAGSYGGAAYFFLAYGGPAQVLFDGNEITGSGGASTSDASTVYLAGGSTTLTNNIIAGNKYEGILLGQLSGSNRILNNTIWGNAASGIVYRSDDLGDLVVANNIVAANQLFGIWLPQLAVLHSNDVWGNGDNYFPGQDRTGVDGNLSLLPALLDPAAGDWRLSPCSPLVDKGSSQDAPTADFYGNPRPSGSTWDIGAAEYQGDGVCHHANLPLLGTIYPVYLPPGAYPGGRCAQKQLTHEGAVVGPLTECVTGVDVLGDGLLRFNFSWVIDFPPDLDYITKYSDTNNRNMYVTDNLGRRYDHVAVSGAAAETTYLEDNIPVYGLFTFLPAGPGAATFAFHDEDQGLLLDKIVIK